MRVHAFVVTIYLFSASCNALTDLHFPARAAKVLDNGQDKEPQRVPEEHNKASDLVTVLPGVEKPASNIYSGYIFSAGGRPSFWTALANR